MMRKILLAITILMLTACALAPAPQDPLSASVSSGAIGAATLAPWGSVESALSPLYTSNAMTRMRAVRALSNGHITKDQARAVLAHTDRARAVLDTARTSRDVSGIDAARAEIEAADEVMK